MPSEPFRASATDIPVSAEGKLQRAGKGADPTKAPVMGRRREPVLLKARRHGVVLFAPLAKALLLSALGLVLVFRGWPFSTVGAMSLALSALVSLAAVWRWERTHLVVTEENVLVRHGTLRRRSASVHLASIESVEVEQTLLGRLLGYGTLVIGPLEVDHVPRPAAFARLVER